jgi:mannose-6-phosphate isomerase-like protein (cupin superfamily)
MTATSPRLPFIKHISEIPVESAHGGSGSRQLLLSSTDPVSPKFQAMTKGFLPAGAIFDWHDHDKIDEFFLVLSGSGYIEFESGVRMDYKPDDLIYIPSNTKHRIENTGLVENEFYFVRLDA